MSGSSSNSEWDKLSATARWLECSSQSSGEENPIENASEPMDKHLQSIVNLTDDLPEGKESSVDDLITFAINVLNVVEKVQRPGQTNTGDPDPALKTNESWGKWIPIWFGPNNDVPLLKALNTHYGLLKSPTGNADVTEIARSLARIDSIFYRLCANGKSLSTFEKDQPPYAPLDLSKILRNSHCSFWNKVQKQSGFLRQENFSPNTIRAYYGILGYHGTKANELFEEIGDHYTKILHILNRLEVGIPPFPEDFQHKKKIKMIALGSAKFRANVSGYAPFRTLVGTVEQ